MATLRFKQDPKTVGFEYLGTEEPVISESTEFIEFRKQYYRYHYEFISRAKDIGNINKIQLSIYKKLATVENFGESLFGLSENNMTLVKKYQVDLFVDFNLSRRKAKEIFKKTSDEIWNKIESMYDDTRIENKDFITEFPLTANGKKADVSRLFEAWDKALKVYDLYEKQEKKCYADISRQLKWFNKDDRHHCSDEVKYYLKYAEKLIEAASKRELYEEACKPMTIGKKRKKAD